MPDPVITSLYRASNAKMVAFRWTWGDQENLTFRTCSTTGVDGLGSHEESCWVRPGSGQTTLAPDVLSRSFQRSDNSTNLLEIAFPFSGTPLGHGGISYAMDVSKNLPDNTTVLGYTFRPFEAIPSDLKSALMRLPTGVTKDPELLASVAPMLGRLEAPRKPNVVRSGLGRWLDGPGFDDSSAISQPFHVRWQQSFGSAARDPVASMPRAIAGAASGRVRSKAADIRQVEDGLAEVMSRFGAL